MSMSKLYLLTGLLHISWFWEMSSSHSQVRGKNRIGCNQVTDLLSTMEMKVWCFRFEYIDNFLASIFLLDKVCNWHMVPIRSSRNRLLCWRNKVTNKNEKKGDKHQYEIIKCKLVLFNIRRRKSCFYFGPPKFTFNHFWQVNLFIFSYHTSEISFFFFWYFSPQKWLIYIGRHATSYSF